MLRGLYRGEVRVRRRVRVRVRVKVRRRIIVSRVCYAASTEVSVEVSK